MCNVSRKIGALLCTFGVILMFLAGLMFNVSAAEIKKGHLTLTCEYDGFYIPGMTWQIYQVGERRGNSFVLTDDFADYPVDLSEITKDTESMTEAASTLGNFAVLDDISPDRLGRTNKKGEVKFNSLYEGIYLAVGMKIKIDNTTYYCEPLLFEIGAKDKVEAYPKFMTKYTIPGQIDRFVMKKIWVNTDLADAPDSLTVEIYENGELFDTVQIKASDNWEYSWEGSADSDWKVKEVSVPAGCFVMYRNNSVQFVIMNSYDNDLLALVTTTTSTALTTTTTVTTTSINQSGSKTTEMTTSQTEDGGDYSRTTSATTSTAGTNTTEDGGSGSRTATTTTISTTEEPGLSTVSGDTETTLSGGTETTVSGSTETTVSGGTETTVSGETETTVSGSTETTISGNNSTSSTESGTVVISKTSSVSNSTRTNRDTTVTTSTGKLPQTGQLWWPVPVMLFSGLILVAVGFRLLLNDKKED